MNIGPCTDWVPIWSCETMDTASPVATGYAVAAATHILWGATGRRFDTCTITVRPSSASVLHWPHRYSHHEVDAWTWCSLSDELTLTAPVRSIVQVKVDGTVLVTGAYKLYDSRYLVRTDGNVWPRSNPLTLADTEVGTWSVTLTYGEDVSMLGQLACGELACEILRAMNGEDCRLPREVQQLTRQGVTIAYPDVTELLLAGNLGLYLCDLFINLENPRHLRRRAQVYNIDAPPAHRET